MKSPNLKKLLLASAIFCSPIATQLQASASNPRPSPSPVSVGIDSELDPFSVVTDGELAKKIAFLLGRLTFYRDLDDPGLLWAVPRYATDSRFPASWIPYNDEIELNRSMNSLWKQVKRSLPPVYGEAADKNFNNDLGEAVVAESAGSSSLGPKLTETDVEFQDKLVGAASEKINAAFFYLTPSQKQAFVSAVAVEFESIGLSFPEAANLSDARKQTKIARNMITSELNVRVLRGLSPEEQELFSQFKSALAASNKRLVLERDSSGAVAKDIAAKDIRFMTLPIKQQTITVTSRPLSEKGFAEDGVTPALRGPTDLNIFNRTLLDIGSISLPQNGGVISQKLNWNAHTSLLRLAKATDPKKAGKAHIDLAYLVGTQAQFNHTASGQYVCRGSELIKGKIELSVSKYKNQGDYYNPSRLNTVQRQGATTICTLEGASGVDVALLEGEYRKQAEDRFAQEFSRQVEASLDMKQAQLYAWLDTGATEWEAAQPQKTYSYTTRREREECRTEFVKAGCLKDPVFGACLMRLPDVARRTCRPVIENIRNYYTQTIPFHFSRAENVEEMVNTVRTYPVSLNADSTLQIGLSTDICLIGDTTSDQDVLILSACENLGELQKAKDDQPGETRGGDI
jgi:hypothetical protein